MKQGLSLINYNNECGGPGLSVFRLPVLRLQIPFQRQREDARQVRSRGDAKAIDLSMVSKGIQEETSVGQACQGRAFEGQTIRET